MRRTGLACMLVIVSLVGVVGNASAKGSSLRFDRDSYEPGDTATAHARVRVWRGAHGQPEEGPYAVYLVRGRQPLWFGHLSADAVHVADLDTRGFTPITNRRGTDIFSVELAFDVPAIEPGRYAVWVCRKACGANSAFGDLVDGSIQIGAGTGTERTAGGAVAAAGDPMGARPWVVAAVSMLSVLVAFALLSRRSRRTTI